jgi:hypothetical protein
MGSSGYFAVFVTNYVVFGCWGLLSYAMGQINPLLEWFNNIVFDSKYRFINKFVGLRF